MCDNVGVRLSAASPAPPLQPEILVDPAYQRRGIGRAPMDRALAHAPRGALFFGAQPQAVGSFERLGCRRALTGFTYGAPRPVEAAPPPDPHAPNGPRPDARPPDARA